MSNKVIWSTNKTRDYLQSLGDEEKFNILVDRGYDPEMLGTNDLNSVLADDDYLWQEDSEDFDSEIAPRLGAQSKDGIVLMVGEAGRWDGPRAGGMAIYPEELKGGDIDPSVDEVELIDDGEGVTWLGHHHDGTHNFKLYAIPEDTDNLIEFVSTCMTDAIDEDEDPTKEIEYIATNLDPEMITDYCDFSKVPEVCERIKADGLLTEGEQINEVTVKEPKRLEKEYEELKKLSDEYGFEYFTSMPLTAYDNDPQSVEYQYPEFFKIVKAFFKEMGILSSEELKDTDALDNEWDVDINQHDWDTLMKTCEQCINNKTHSYQIEKIYKNGYATLDDDEILADREKEAERAAEYGDEELNEAADKFSIELDIVSDEETPEAVIDEIRSFDVSDKVDIEVIDMMGPGGGWPVVKFTGTKKDLIKELDKLGFDELEDDEFIPVEIKESCKDDVKLDESVEDVEIISAHNFGDDYYGDIRIIFKYNGNVYNYHDGTTSSGWGDTGEEISKEYDLSNALHEFEGVPVDGHLIDVYKEDLIKYVNELENSGKDTLQIREPEDYLDEETITRLITKKKNRDSIDEASAEQPVSKPEVPFL